MAKFAEWQTGILNEINRRWYLFLLLHTDNYSRKIGISISYDSWIIIYKSTVYVASKVRLVFWRNAQYKTKVGTNVNLFFSV